MQTTMPGDDKKDGKGSKLSLSKKPKKTVKGSGSAPVLPGVREDLNESSSEFREPMAAGGSGDSKRNKANVPVEEPIRCQVCWKKMNHLNSQRRAQHVNKCIDITEAKINLEKKEAALLKAAKTRTLECPMCGKSFKSDSSRKAHLKKCSQELGVETGQMLQLVRDQETERQNMVAAKIIPPALRKADEKQTAAKQKRKVKEPKDQFEEDIQVAMAISSSLTEKHGERDLNGLLKETANVKKGKDSKKGKKTPCLKDVCLLLTLSSVEKQQRLEDRVAEILVQEDADTMHIAPPPLFESQLRTSGPYQRAGLGLWQRASLPDRVSNKDLFYVGSLMPPISYSRVDFGERIKRKPSIPGRETSFVEQKRHVQPRSTKDESVVYDEVIAASTQTAAVLAELAVDVGDSSQLVDRSQRGDSSQVDLQATGFCVEKLSLKESDRVELRTQTLSDFRRLINQREFSDVTVASLETSFHAHRLVLAARCPQLVKHIENSTLTLGISAEAAWALLTFLYAGELTVSQSAQTELLELCEKLELPPLKKACALLQLDDETSEGNGADVRVQAGYPEIDLKEIWGVSDSEEEIGANTLKEREASDDDITGLNVNVQDSSTEPCDIDKEGTFNALLGIQEYGGEDSSLKNPGHDVLANKHSENQEIKRTNAGNPCHFNVKGEEENSSGFKDILKQVGKKRTIKVETDVEEKDNSERSAAKRIKLENNTDFMDSSGDSDRLYTEMEEVPETVASHLSDTAEDAENVVSEQVDNSPNTFGVGISCMIKTNESVSPVAMNTSNIDLFGSPSPVIMRQTRSVVRDVSDTSVSRNIGQVTPKKLRINPLDTMSKRDVLSCAEAKEEDNIRNLSLSKPFDKEKSPVDCKNKSSVSPGSLDIASDDTPGTAGSDNDDLEITGDNFNEIGKGDETMISVQMSPVFSGKQETKHSSLQISSSWTYTEMNPVSEIDYITDTVSSATAMMSEETAEGSADDIQKFDDDLEPCFDDSFNALSIPLSQVCKKAMHAAREVDSESTDSMLTHEGVIEVNCDPKANDVGAKSAADEVEMAGDFKEMSEGDTNEDSNVWDGFVDQGVDCEMMDDDNLGYCPKEVHSESRFRTPSVQEETKGTKKPWLVPSPFTPMPTYNNMATPKLKKEVQKYGVKPVGKKRMIKVLEDIYKQTHQYETDSECEEAYLADSEPTATDGRTDTSGEEDLSASQDIVCSQEQIPDFPEESYLHVPSSDSDTSSSPQKAGDLKRKLTNYIMKDESLHIKIVMYEPLELDVLKAGLKEASIKCSMEKLMEFLDEKCIAFTTKNSRKQPSSRRGKRRAPKATQKSPKKKKTKS